MATLNFGSIMIGTDQHQEMADFYEEVFQAKPDMEEGEGWHGWLVGKTFITIGAHSEVHGKSKEPQRILLNFEAKDVKGEYERISKIKGAEVIKEAYEMGGAWIATIADPDGNYIQIMTPWEEMKDMGKK